MSVGDIYQAVLVANFSSVEVKNVFFYEVSAEPTGPSSASELGFHLDLTVLPAIATCIISDVSMNSIDIVNLGTPSDFSDFTVTPAVLGDRSGLASNPVICWSFRYNRKQPGQRSGWKRFAGIAEADIDFDQPTAAMAIILDAVSPVLEQTLLGTNASYTPVIVKRPIVLGIKPTVFYRPPSVDFAGVGSQVSRKRAFI